MSYRQIFDEAIGHTPPTWIDVDQVVRRQRRAARARPAVAAVAALVLAAGAGTAFALTGEEEYTVPESSDPLAGFPEYIEGTRVIAAASAPMADRALSLTFTPTTLDLVLHTRCSGDFDGELYAQLAIGDTWTEWSFCPAAGVPGMTGAADWGFYWSRTGAEVGEPVTITVRLLAVRPPSGAGEPPLPSEGTFALAVAARVPFDEYRFPTRPAVLEPLPEITLRHVEVRADPADPNRRMATTMIWHADLYGCGSDTGYPFSLLSQTPGSLRVLVNDVEVARHTFWDYGPQEYGYLSDAACDEVADGEEVTLAVEPEHMTGDWLVSLYRPN